MIAPRALGTTALALVVGAAFAASAADEPPREPAQQKTPAQWLEAMDGAFRELDYDGVFSYYTADHRQRMNITAQWRGPGQRSFRFDGSHASAARLATFRIVHKVVDGIERERIEHLNNPHREILRTGDRVTSIPPSADRPPGRAGAAAASPHARVFARRFEAAGDYYQVAFDGRGRVARRSAVRIDIAPRDIDRFGYRLWLDEQTGLLLRSELRDAGGAKLEIFQFTSLCVGECVATEDLEPAAERGFASFAAKTRTAIDESAAASDAEVNGYAESRGFKSQEFWVASERPEPNAEAEVVVSAENLRRDTFDAVDAHDWRARWLPAGFRAATPVASPGDAVHALMFTDGLATFSVFIEAMPEAGAGNVVSRRGATVALTHRVRGVGGDHLVTVVGEVPVATARRVAAGVYQTGP